MIWSENWKDSGSITTRIACTLRSTATHPQKPLVKPPAAVLTSTDSSGNLIAVGYTSYLWQHEQQFAMHRFGQNYLHGFVRPLLDDNRTESMT